MKLGEWDVNQLSRDIPSPLVTEWMAFFELEPWGFSMDMYPAAMIITKLHNIFKPKKARALRVHEALPKTKADQEKSTPGDFFKRLKEFFKGNKQKQ